MKMKIRGMVVSGLMMIVWEIKDDQKLAQNNVVVNIFKIEVVCIIKLNQCMERNEINGVR